MPKAFATDLTTWFKKNGRDLPWRRNRTPYATWVSEIMLQQTQVKTMVPYFNQWMRQIPNIRALAKAPQEKVLKLWQGLGYYSRARNLKKGAAYLVENHKGRLPDTLEELMAIPGIGRYSAGAILSIGFNKKAPIVDGNVLRVLSRVYAIRSAIDDEVTKKEIYRIQESLIPENSAGLFNEAMMELGALVCAPKNPSCFVCPVSKHCRAFKEQLTDQIPYKKTKIKITKVQSCAVILRKKGQVFLHRRPEGRIMGGLWEFPEWKLEGNLKLFPEEQKAWIGRTLKTPVSKILYLQRFKRHYTRFQETMSVFETPVSKIPPSLKNGWENQWVSLENLNTFPLTSAHSKIRLMCLGRSTRLDGKQRLLNIVPADHF
jgi:A/G-specific adenine glycosylase